MAKGALVVQIRRYVILSVLCFSAICWLSTMVFFRAGHAAGIKRWKIAPGVRIFKLSLVPTCADRGTLRTFNSIWGGSHSPESMLFWWDQTTGDAGKNLIYIFCAKKCLLLDKWSFSSMRHRLFTSSILKPFAAEILYFIFIFTNLFSHFAASAVTLTLFVYSRELITQNHCLIFTYLIVFAPVCCSKCPD